MRTNADEIDLSLASRLTGKTVKTMQRWCEEGRFSSRVVDKRGKLHVPLSEVLSSAGIDLDAAEIRVLIQADGGDVDAQCELGVILLERRKPGLALTWLEQAAESRQSEAMHLIALFHAHAMGGLLENQEEALKWLEKSARQGHPIARAQLESIRKAPEASLSPSRAGRTTG